MLALYPEDREAQKRVASLKEELVGMLLKSAQSDLTMPRFEDARRKFLSILFLDPDHEEALRYLKPDALDIIIHEVQEGESLPAIAQRYYGDNLKVNVIVAYNPWVDFAAMGAGERLVIPLTKEIQEKQDKARAEAERKLPLVTASLWAFLIILKLQQTIQRQTHF